MSTGLLQPDKIHQTFAISLPDCITLFMVPRSSHPSTPTDRGARIDRLSQSVFVLEDDSDIARLVQHHLESAGFEARLFHTPTNLIPDAERKAPALFLLDIMSSRWRRSGRLPPTSQPRGIINGSYHFPHSTGRRKRPCSWSRAGRRRLHHEAVFNTGARGSRQGRATPFRASFVALGHQF